MWPKLALLHGCALLSFFPLSLGAIVFSPSQPLPTTTFDYIVVGAGTAGLAVANRLSENSSVTVLVLEAGLEQAVPAVDVPFLAPTLTPNTILDWNTTTVPQINLFGRVLPYNRGRVVGGSSTVNFMFHQYCSSEDWDRLATVSGDSGWNWANMRQYVQKHEQLVPPTDGHDTTGQIIPSTHGTSGLLPVSLPGFNDTTDSFVFQTTKQVAEFPFLPDTSGGDTKFLGVGFLQSSIGEGFRMTSESGYLTHFLSRTNLTVVTNATVVRIAESGAFINGRGPSFKRVGFVGTPPPGTQTITETPTVVTANKEVILAAGTVGTTQLLLLSGIGPNASLASVGVSPIINSNFVGANLMDHLLIPNIFTVKGSTLDNLLVNTTAQQQTQLMWAKNKTGPYTNTVANMYGFLRLPSNSSILAANPDPAAGPDSPHFELIFTNAFFQPGVPAPSNQNFLTVVSVVVSPTSRGAITLQSKNILQMPFVDPGFMTTDFDITTARESVKAAIRFVTSPPWKDYTIGPFGNAFSEAVGDDIGIEEYVRGIGTSAFHAVGTAAIAPPTATAGVVHPNLTVKGTDGLRVVDASVFPFIPSCHIQGPVYLLAERASDLIKAAAASG